MTIEQAFLRHCRAHNIFGCIGDGEEVDTGLDADLVADTDEGLDRGVAGAGTEPTGTTVDLLGSRTNCRNGIGDAQAQVLVAVEADLSVVAEFLNQRLDAIGYLLEYQRAGRVDHVHTLATRVGHDASLLGQLLRRNRVSHHEESDCFESTLTREAEVLDGYVGLGAVSCDTADGRTVVLRDDDVVLDAQSGQHQEGDLRVCRGLDGSFDEFLLGSLREAVVEGGSAETVAVSDLDDRHSGSVEGTDDGSYFVDGELMTLVVGAVAQRCVGDADVPARIEMNHVAHAFTLRSFWAISSPTLVAAAVMMSRLPAYGGRKSPAPSTSTNVVTVA